MASEQLDKLSPNDARLEEHTALLNSRNYSYFVVPPTGPHQKNQPVATIILLHGFPDLPLGWRFQAPMLASLGLRVVMPFMLGYSGTDAPDSESEYSYQGSAADIAALAHHVLTAAGEDPARGVLLGGHDWGAVVAWAAARLYPHVFRAVFSVCVPYLAPSPEYVPLDEVARRIPAFTYMKQFGSEAFEKAIGASRETIRRFLNAMYEPSGGASYFDAATGFLLDKMDSAPPSTLLSEDELDWYAEQYARKGMHAPLNWYRNQRANHGAAVEEIRSTGLEKIKVPSLLVRALRDWVVTDELCRGSEANFENGLEVKPVDGTHWVLQGNRAGEVNAILREWVGRMLEEVGGLKKL